MEKKKDVFLCVLPFAYFMLIKEHQSEWRTGQNLREKVRKHAEAAEMELLDRPSN